MRQIGYYWCREDNDTQWEIAFWNGDNWEVKGSHYLYTDRVWDEIDETPIKRDKQ